MSGSQEPDDAGDETPEETADTDDGDDESASPAEDDGVADSASADDDNNNDHDSQLQQKTQSPRRSVPPRPRAKQSKNDLTAAQRLQLLNPSKAKRPAAAASSAPTGQRPPPPQQQRQHQERKRRAQSPSPRQGGIRAPKRQRRPEPGEDNQGAEYANVAARRQRVPPAAAAAAAAAGAGGGGDGGGGGGDGEDNDAFQTVEIKRPVPICKVPRDIYPPELEARERADEKKTGGGPGWCPLCIGRKDAAWKQPFHDMVRSYPETDDPVRWAAEPQAKWEAEHYLPDMEEVVKNMKPDPVTGEIRLTDPDLKMTKFFWPRRTILDHFRRHRVFPVVRLADRIFKLEQLLLDHEEAGVKYQLVTTSPNVPLPPIDPNIPTQVDHRGQKAYIEVIKQIERTQEQLQAALDALGD